MGARGGIEADSLPKVASRACKAREASERHAWKDGSSADTAGVGEDDDDEGGSADGMTSILETSVDEFT